MAHGLIIIFGLTMLYLATTSRFQAHIRLLTLQGILLFLICCCGFDYHHSKAPVSTTWLQFQLLVVSWHFLFHLNDESSLWCETIL